MNPNEPQDSSVENQVSQPDENQNQNQDDVQDTGDGADTSKGGPSDVEKMKRLEREKAEIEAKNREYEEKLKTMEDVERKAKEEGMTDEEKFEAEQRDFYMGVATNTVKIDLGEEFNKLPERIKKAIENDPIALGNALDAKQLDFAIRATGSNSLKVQFEAAAKEVIKLVRETFVQSPSSDSANASGDDDKTRGVNPPLENKDMVRPGNKMSYWDMTDEELDRQVQMEKRQTLK